MTSHTFLALSSGRHTFEVKSRDLDFNEDPNPAVLSFTVLPPVWQQTWFVVLVAVMLSAVISLVRGFVKEAFSLAIWVLAFWLSWSFFRDLEVPLRDWIGSPTARLGIVPVGTGNDFAKACAISLDWEAAADALAARLARSQSLRVVDVGRMNGRYFANGVGIGFDAKVTRLARACRLPIHAFTTR